MTKIERKANISARRDISMNLNSHLLSARHATPIVPLAQDLRTTNAPNARKKGSRMSSDFASAQIISLTQRMGNTSAHCPMSS